MCKRKGEFLIIKFTRLVKSRAALWPSVVKGTDKTCAFVKRHDECDTDECDQELFLVQDEICTRNSSKCEQCTSKCVKNEEHAPECRGHCVFVKSNVVPRRRQLKAADGPRVRGGRALRARGGVTLSISMAG
jgi:hypothetical protein